MSWCARIFFRSIERVLEWQPFADAKVEIAFLLHLFEDKEVIPGAEVLYAGDTVRQRVIDGEFVTFAPFVVAGRRNDLVHEVLC